MSGWAPTAAKSALQGERLGLWSGDEFLLTTSGDHDCALSPAIRWHTQDAVLAVPRGSDCGAPFVWISAPSLLEGVRLSADGASVTGPQGGTLRLALTPQLRSNRSFYNQSTACFFSGPPLRLRGTVEHHQGEPVFVARMLWRDDWLIRPDHLPLSPLQSDRMLAQLIEAQQEAAAGPLQGRRLWARRNSEPRPWTGQPVLAFVLNGAQADDDESHAGHLSLATGRLGPRGEWADWIVNNVYPMETVSEKGILAGMVPMDAYLAELNSGQAYYRPSYMTVAVLRDERTAARFQAAIQETFHRVYSGRKPYHHATMNSTGMPIDTLRAVGWQVPPAGCTSRLLAIPAWLYIGLMKQDRQAAASMFRYLTEEKTRVFPRAAFEAATLDLLRLAEHRTARRLTPYEERLQADVEAVLFIRIPQIPSSRAFGTAPVVSFEQYRQRVPADRSAWNTVPLEARPFPSHLQEDRRIRK
jgi:hypothetical protein